jgi:hypothetical protein
MAKEEGRRVCRPSWLLPGGLAGLMLLLHSHGDLLFIHGWRSPTGKQRVVGSIVAVFGREFTERAFT